MATEDKDPPTWAVELAGLAWTYAPKHTMDSELAMAFAQMMSEHCLSKERAEDGLRFAEEYLSQSNLTGADREYAKGCKSAFTGLIKSGSHERPPRLRLVKP